MKYKSKSISAIEAVQYDATQESIDAIRALGVKEFWKPEGGHLLSDGKLFDGENTLDVPYMSFVAVTAKGEASVKGAAEMATYYDATGKEEPTNVPTEPPTAITIQDELAQKNVAEGFDMLGQNEAAETVKETPDKKSKK